MSSSRAFESAARIRASSSGVELALRADRLEHRGAALLQLAQVAQPLLQGAQLGVVQGAGGLLAVAGDERDRRAAVEQLDRGPHLVRPDAELVGDPLRDGLLRAGPRGTPDSGEDVVLATPHRPGPARPPGRGGCGSGVSGAAGCVRRPRPAPIATAPGARWRARPASRARSPRSPVRAADDPQPGCLRARPTGRPTGRKTSLSRPRHCGRDAKLTAATASLQHLRPRSLPHRLTFAAPKPQGPSPMS